MPKFLDCFLDPNSLQPCATELKVLVDLAKSVQSTLNVKIYASWFQILTFMILRKLLIIYFLIKILSVTISDFTVSKIVQKLSHVSHIFTKKITEERDRCNKNEDAIAFD